MVIIGASSLHLALEDWASAGGNEELQEDVIHYKGVTFHPKSKANKIVRNILRDEIIRNESVIIWHDVINNPISEHPFNPRTPLTANQLVSEIKPLINSHPRIEGIVYCQRDGAPYILEDLKKLPIPVVQVTTDIISSSKQDKDLLEGYRALHQETAFEIKTLAIIRNNNNNLSDILKKKKKPSKKTTRSTKETRTEINCEFKYQFVTGLGLIVQAWIKL